MAGGHRILKSVAIAGLVVSAVPIAIATSVVPALAAPTPACDGAEATIVGTAAADVLIGTSGRDVIFGGAGDDVIIGNRGDDLLCGGQGDDLIIGAVGDDQLEGDVGADVLIGSFGDDALIGGNGDDVLYGGQGNDALAGNNGADLSGAGSGDDDLTDSNGNDTLLGGDGYDTAVAGKGSDACLAEAVAECEQTVQDSQMPVTAQVTAPSDGANLDQEANANVVSTAGDGLALVEFYASGELVGYEYLGASSTIVEQVNSFTLDPTNLPTGRLELIAVATDVDGDDTSSETVTVDNESSLAPEGPTTGLVLTAPTPLSELFPALAESGLPVVEFRHERQLAEPLPPASTVAALAAADGRTVSAFSTSVTGGFYGRGLPLVEQMVQYSTSYAAQTGSDDPVISALRLDGTYTEAALGPLAAFVAVFEPFDAPTTNDGVDTAAGQLARLEASAGPSPEDDKIAAAEGDNQRSHVQATEAAAEPATEGFWPTYGQMDTNELVYEKKVANGCGMLMICNVPWPPWGSHTVQEPHAIVSHDLAWDNERLAEFDGSNRSYEHDLKLAGTGRSGKRPLCDLDSASEYLVRGHGVVWETTFPSSAHAYWDWDASDDCNSYDFTIGVARPENLAVDEPADLVAYRISIDAVRGDGESSPFELSAQSLTKNKFQCDLLDSLSSWFDRYCVGLDVTETIGADIATTETLGQEMPTCFAWRWSPFADRRDGPDVLNGCTGDQDGDGWDDLVDCDDSDPDINPGAVDIPNDGIDQDCSGADLVVGEGTVQFTLVWDTDADMDLHVIEPNGTRIWYASRGPTATGGRLDRDDNVCGSIENGPGGVENVFWPEDEPAPVGTYEVEVREYSLCDDPDPATWTLEIRVEGELVETFNGVGGDQTVAFSVP